MYAVVKTGGKQYRVEPGHVVEVEYLDGNVGDKIELKEVLLIERDGEVKVGKPSVAGAKVSVEILAQKRGPKLIIFKKIKRHGYRRFKGHRQELTRLKINEISI